MWDADKFRREEDGALLVFFALCSAAIFLIAALSFDVGRRASTQTDLQSFADNVALAAAGELNGLPGAISRARRAADQLIDDSTRFSDDNELSGLSDFTLTFYETLPDDENTWATPVAYNAGDTLNSGDALARFVRIEVNPRDVEWQFANILSIFSDTALPDEAVAAEATAGYTSLACDVAPVFFCMPPAQPEDLAAGSPIWDPENHKGDSILLKAGGGGGPNAWRPGNFGYLDVIGMTPEDARTDPASPCFGITSPPALYSCLLAAESAVTLCFENGGLGFEPGGAEGIRSATLNTKFDMYDATLNGVQNDDRFRPAPVVTKKFAAGETCAPGGGSGGGNTGGGNGGNGNGGDGDNGNGNNGNGNNGNGNNGGGDTGGGGAAVPASLTMDFPADDCFENGPGYAGCLTYTDGNGGNAVTRPRFGDGDWSEGRLLYVDINYSLDLDSHGTVLPSEVVDGYHLDDPFRPAVTDNPRKPEYLTFPVVPNDAWRWNYYNAEVAAAYFLNPSQAYVSATGEVNLGFALGASANDLIRDFQDIDGNVTGTRPGSSLPSCAPEPAIDPRRRTIVAAAVDCAANAPYLNGNSGGLNGTATWFVEVFMPSVAGGVATAGDHDFYVEVISGGLQNGDPSFANGTFRNLVQLYR